MKESTFGKKESKEKGNKYLVSFEQNYPSVEIKCDGYNLLATSPLLSISFFNYDPTGLYQRTTCVVAGVRKIEKVE